MKNIDVFIDMEGLGISGGETGLRKIEFIALELPPALEKEGYAIASVAGFASYKRRREIVPPWMQKKIRNSFVSRQWQMIWTDRIADLALISNAMDRLAKGTLVPSVMLIASDHDFIRLAYLIVKSGRTLLVSGQNMSRGLQSVATKAFPFWEFLGGHPDKFLPGDKRRAQYRASIPNPLPMPDIKIQ